MLTSQFFTFLALIQVPGLLKNLREAPGMYFHLVAPVTEPVWPSYDQKTEKMKKKKSHFGLTPGIGHFWLKIRIQHTNISQGTIGILWKPSSDLKFQETQFSTSFFQIRSWG